MRTTKYTKYTKKLRTTNGHEWTRIKEWNHEIHYLRFFVCFVFFVVK